MFAKPFRVKSKTAMRSSNMRKLQDDIIMTFPTLAPNELSELIPGEDTVISVKVETYKRNTVTVYMIKGDPILFQLSKHLHPTVYTLWRYPHLLPTFLTWPIIFESIVRGAELMLPGLAIPLDGLPGVQKGDICGIALPENRAPVAVGVALMSTTKMLNSRLQGKGISILHTYQDHLWQYGNKTDPPLIPAPTMAYPDHSDNDSIDFEPVLQENMEYLTLDDDDDMEREGAEKEEEEPEFHQLSKLTSPSQAADLETRKMQRQMDQLLRFCFFQALKYSVTRRELPLLASNLLTKHMLSCCPEGQQLDLKKSSYKTLSAFLQRMQEEHVLELKELKEGVEVIVMINWKHPQITPCVIEEPSTSLDKGRQAYSYRAPVIKYLYYAPTSMNPLFRGSGFKKGIALDSADIRSVIVDYAERNLLFETTDKKSVRLDEVLIDCILEKNEKGKIKKLPLDNLLSRCFERMQPAYQLTFPGQEPIMRKGEITPINITLVQRALNKTVTVVRNLEAYGLSPHSVAAILRQRCHASAGVVRVPGTKNSLQLQIQGNQIQQLNQLLLQEYHLPSNSVESRESFPRGGRK